MAASSQSTGARRPGSQDNDGPQSDEERRHGFEPGNHTGRAARVSPSRRAAPRAVGRPARHRHRAGSRCLRGLRGHARRDRPQRRVLRRQQRRQGRRRTGVVRSRRHPRRAGQRGPRRGIRFRAARHRAAERHRAALQHRGGGGTVMRRAALLLTFALVVGAALAPLAKQAAAPPRWPGVQGNGITLLPNGWRIAPAGRHVHVGDLPMNLVPSRDGRFLVVSTSGWEKPALVVFDTKSLQVVSRTPIDHTWLGLAWHPDGTRLFASGSSENTIVEFTWNDGRLTQAGTIVLGDPERHPGGDRIENAGFVTGLAVSPDGQRLYATQLYGQMVRL